MTAVRLIESRFLSLRRQEEKSGERKLLLEDVVGAAPGVRDMGAVGWGAAGAVHDRDGMGEILFGVRCLLYSR